MLIFLGISFETVLILLAFEMLTGDRFFLRSNDYGKNRKTL